MHSYYNMIDYVPYAVLYISYDKVHLGLEHCANKYSWTDYEARVYCINGSLFKIEYRRAFLFSSGQKQND